MPLDRMPLTALRVIEVSLVEASESGLAAIESNGFPILPGCGNGLPE